MAKYLIQCVSGLQDVVAAALGREAFAATVAAAEEGFLVIETAVHPGELRKLPYINNSFLVLGELPAGTLEAALVACAEDARWQSAAAGVTTSHDRTFRFMLQDEGELVAAPPAVHRASEAIARATGLRRDPRRADAEFWFIRRQSGAIYFGRRVSQRARTEKDLEKGELRPELARLLCFLSEPAPTDIFVDPFAGSGAIPLARATLPYNMIFCFDRDQATVTRLKARFKTEAPQRKNAPIITHLADGRKLERLQDGFVDKVVTDPPWGFFDQSVGDPLAFTLEVGRELCRVTKPGGLIVLLLGRRELIEPLERELAPAIEPRARHDLLVAGKKAAVLKWQRALSGQSHP